MIELQFPHAQPSAQALPGAAVDDGVLAVVRERADLERLLRLCVSIRAGSERRFTRPAGREEPRADDWLRQLVGALLSGRAFEGDADERGVEPSDLHADDPFAALVLGLQAILDLWPRGREGRADASREEGEGLALAVALALPGAVPGGEVGIRLAQPRAALWLTPGSILAGITVGTALKALRWCALVVSTVAAPSADAAARRLVEDLRRQAALASRYEPMPRLDGLSDDERRSLRGKPVLIVFLHGLFGTDLRTFDGFISRLRQATPAHLEATLKRLAASSPGQMVQAHVGLQGLLESFRQALSAGGERIARANDLETTRFIEQQVGWLGWPHDSLAAIDTCATELAALLHKEFGANTQQAIVFVAHSQGGLLARAAALALVQMNAPAARWADRVAAIVTFGTPHRGAAITEPGARGGREAALYLMMLSGTGKPTSLGDVLTLVGERRIEGIEDLKPFNASTGERENAYVQRLLKEEMGQAWPNGGHRPGLMMVGGRLTDRERATWGKRLLAPFIDRKLPHDDHDLVVELRSSIATLLDPRFSLTIASDHFGYFNDDAESSAALDAAVALVWTLLAGAIPGWLQALAADDERRKQGTARFKLQPKKPE